MTQGHADDRIARQLFVSGKTVRNYASNIFTNLQVTSRAEAVVRAREAGLGVTTAGGRCAERPPR